MLYTYQGSLSNVNAMNTNGETPLHVVAASRGSSMRVMSFLINHDADINAINRYRFCWSNVFYSLVSTIIATLLKLGFLCLHSSNIRFGESPLHLAVREGRIDLIRLLLDEGAETGIIGRDGSPKDIALSNKRLDIVELIEKEGKSNQASLLLNLTMVS